MSALRTIIASLPSFCQNLSKLVEIWQSSDNNKFSHFFEHGAFYAEQKQLINWC